MRSDSQPQPCRLKKPMPSSTDSMLAPIVAGDAEVAAERDQMLLRHRHGDAAQERGEREHAEHDIADSSRTPSARRQRSPAASAWTGSSGGGRRKIAASGTMTTSCRTREADHGPAPAEHRDRALEDGRPDEAGEIAAARDQRQRRAAAAVEPAADIDEQRRVQSGVAEQAHEQAVADIELPRRAAATTAQGRSRSSSCRSSRSSGCRSGWRSGPSGCRRRRCRRTPATPRAPAPGARRRCRRRSPSSRPR